MRYTAGFLLPGAAWAAAPAAQPPPGALGYLLAATAAAVLAVLSWSFVRRRHKAALEERFRDLFDNTSYLIFTCTPDGSITSLNRAAERAFGHRPGRIPGATLPDLLAPEHREAAARLLARLAAGESLPPFDLDLATPAGGRRTLEIGAHLLRRPGRPPEIQGIARDVTGRVREAAEAAARARSEFLANLSHEIGTPLSGLVRLAEVLRDTPLDDEQRECLGNIRGTAELLLTVLGGFQDSPKIESGSLALEEAPFALRPFLEDSLRALLVRADREGPVVVRDVRPDVPEWVVGDALRLRQILLNLMGNAMRITGRGGISVAVECAERGAAGVLLRFSVAEAAAGGVVPDRHAGICEALEQAGGSATRRPGGAGLGLAMSARLTALMGGGLRVDSRAGEGSTFTFTARLRIAGAEHAGPPPPVPRRPLRILLAGDNPVNRKLAKLLLEKQGHSVAVAANGAGALRASAREDFDLCLMDVQMPEMDGLACARAVRDRERGKRRRLPIVAMSARALESERERCLAAGMDAYVSKPVGVKELAEAIERCAGAARPR